MEKNFFAVFPGLKVKKAIEEFLEPALVSRVSCNREKTHLRIYLSSEKWIHKKYIYQLEEEIRRQLFPGMPMEVTVVEKFCLSAQYTPENFLDIYKDSMCLELRNTNMLEYSLFQNAKITFADSHTMCLKLPDTMVGREKGELLMEYLEKIFCQRCGMDLKIEPEYIKVKESKYRKNSEQEVE